MEFPRQEYWSGLPFPSPGDPRDWEIELGSPALQADSLLIELIRTVTIKNRKSLVLVNIWRSYKFVNLFWNVKCWCMEVLQKIKNRIIIWSGNPISGWVTSKIIKNRILKSICTPMFIGCAINPCDPCLLGHNSQNVVAMSMSRGGWVEKENVVYT